MINEAELGEMTPAERRRLAHRLAAMDYPRSRPGMYARRRRVAIAISVVACAVLVAWIVVLAMSLHRSFHTHHWRGAWVGFDFILLLAFAATGWAFWRGRQIVIACLLVTGTLLCCDAWFDIVLDAGTSEVWLSVASALFVELPMAFLMFNGARRLIRLSALLAMGRPDAPDAPGAAERPANLLEDCLPPLWRIPLFGERAAGRDSVAR
ncbi:MAG TPA: hypothetical protein VGD91_18390 [Trebonia sp.]